LKISAGFAVAPLNVEEKNLSFIGLADTFRLYAKLHNFFGKTSSEINL